VTSRAVTETSVVAGGSRPWLAIVGIGEDGVDGLGAAARSLIADAAYVFGGKRHLALAAPLIHGEAVAWPSPMAEAMPRIAALRGQPVTVLASGDPLNYGIGARLAEVFGGEERIVVPALSAFSLAAARLGWSLPDADTHSLCGQPIETLIPLLRPSRRLLVLSADETTPAAVAQLLNARGFGPTRLHLLEALGGPAELVRTARADAFDLDRIGRLNMLGIEVEAGPDARVVPLGAGLDDSLFGSDGMLTKREIRAVTLSSLEPHAGGLLWDIGTGSGSIAIEWLLQHPANRAVAIEARPDRAQRAAENAVALGVPRLRVVEGAAPDALAGLPRPDAVFVGGGASVAGVLDAAWAALPSGGRLVANSVTVETDAALTDALGRFGGTLTRLSVERLDKLGTMHGFRPAMTVTQWKVRKP
jgi:precorrin-6Y C5,15-methyltransferase (decarboxylating)